MGTEVRDDDIVNFREFLFIMGRVSGFVPAQINHQVVYLFLCFVKINFTGCN